MVPLLVMMLSSLPLYLSNGHSITTPSSSAASLHYVVQEECTPGTLIGNPLRDAKIYHAHPSTKDAKQRPPFFELMFGNKEVFSFNETTGDMRTARRLDRESLCGRQQHHPITTSRRQLSPDLEAVSYTNVSLTTEATQKCQLELSMVVRGDDNLLETWINIHIVVMDLNDNNHYFEQNLWNITLSELVPVGSTFKLPLALDADEPEHAVRRYVLFDESTPNICRGYFSISCQSQLVDCDLRLVVSKQIDFEVCQKHDLLLAAEDASPESGGAILPLQVFIRNENEHAPRFVLPPNSLFSLSRDAPVGRFITQVLAQDDDDLSAEITYSTDSPLFDVSGGRVLLKGNLHECRDNQVTFEIVAKDDGAPPKQTSITLTVGIIDTGGKDKDAQRNVHIFIKPLGGEAVNGEEAHLLIPNSAEPERLIALMWTDSAAAVASCELRPNISSLALEKAGLLMGRPTFTLKVTRAYDFSKTFHTMRSTVEGMETHVVCGSAVMRLRLRLAPPPGQQFRFRSSQARVFVEESSSPIVSFYTLAPVNGVGQVFFAKDPTSTKCESVHVNARLGTLTIPYGVDRERTPELHCIFSATDSDRPSNKITLSVFIAVTDVNDCAPSLTQLDYTVPEFDHLSHGSRSMPNWVSLIKLDASDPDAGQNGSVRFELRGIRAPQGFTDYRLPKMRISQDTGELAVFVSDYHLFDREEISGFTLLVYLFDLGSPFRLSASFEVKLHLADINDNPPLFVDAENTDLLEGLPWYRSSDPVPGVWTQIQVFDPDLGENGTTKISVVDNFGVPSDLPLLRSQQVSLFDDGRLWIDQATVNSADRHAIWLLVTDFGSRRQLQTKTKLIVDRDADRTRIRRPSLPMARETGRQSTAVGFVQQSNTGEARTGYSGDAQIILVTLCVGVVICIFASILIAYLVLRK